MLGIIGENRIKAANSFECSVFIIPFVVVKGLIQTGKYVIGRGVYGGENGVFEGNLNACQNILYYHSRKVDPNVFPRILLVGKIFNVGARIDKKTLSF